MRTISLSHPVWGDFYVFSLFPCPPLQQQLLLLTSKPFELNLTYLGQRKYGSGKIYWMTFPWPWSKAMAVALIDKNVLCFFQGQTLLDISQSYFRNGTADWYGTGGMWVVIIHDHDCDLWVGWVDVPDSDQGDFRCRHAIDMSSSICFHMNSNNVSS